MGYQSALDRVPSAATVAGEAAALKADFSGVAGIQSAKAVARVGIAQGWAFLVFQAVALVAASLVSGVIYHELVFHMHGPLRAFFAMGMLAALLYTGGMRMAERAEKLRVPLSFAAIRDASFAWLAVFLILSFVTVALKAAEEISRGSFIAFFILGYLGIIGSRAFFPGLIESFPTLRQRRGDVIVIGARLSPALETIKAELAMSGIPSPRVIAVDASCTDDLFEAELPLWLGRIFTAAREMGHGEICIAAEGFTVMQLESITSAIRIIPRSVRVVLPPAVEHMLHLPVRSIGNIYSIEVQRSPMGVIQLGAKRIMDLAVSVPMAVFLAPLFLVIAAAIKWDSKGPILFRQKRLGYRGEVFSILKFRTMTTLEDGAEVKQVEKNDIRVTRLGRFLRKSSLDELPQLINVVFGQMSLVGPRPHAVAHDRLFVATIPFYEVRQHVKPGITGWAQVNGLRGGSESSPDWILKRVEHDIWYAKNANIWLDLKIIFLTFFEIFRQTNAY